LRKYRGEFWNASSRLKVYDELVKKENKLHDAEMEIRKVALENMELQKDCCRVENKS